MNPFMKLAYDEALSGISQQHGGPFGAVIVKDGEVIAQAHNEVLLGNDPTAHAEIVAIRKACEALGRIDLSDCTLYATAKPCPMCTGAIQWSRIGGVLFSGGYDDTRKLNFDDLDYFDSFMDEGKKWTQIDREYFSLILEKFEQYKQQIRY